MSDSTNYGGRYWVITGEGDPLHLMADRLEVMPNGALVAWGGWREKGEDKPKESQPIFALAHKQWETFYAASMWTGAPVCADPDR